MTEQPDKPINSILAFNTIYGEFDRSARQAVDLLRPHLYELLIANPPALYKDKEIMVKKLNKMFNAADVVIKHPKLSSPCYLDVHLPPGGVSGAIRVRPIGGIRPYTLKEGDKIELIDHVWGKKRRPGPPGNQAGDGGRTG